MKRPAAKEQVEPPVVPEGTEPSKGEPTAAKAKAKCGMKRPAASPPEAEAVAKKRSAPRMRDPDEPGVAGRAYKYLYHDSQKWGIKNSLKQEMLTIRPDVGITAVQLERIAVQTSFGK